MKRYNVSGMPVQFDEVLNGYWIKYDDYEQSLLENNKSASRMWDSEMRYKETIDGQYSEKLEKQQHIIIILSVACFALSAIGLFQLLMH